MFKKTHSFQSKCKQDWNIVIYTSYCPNSQNFNRFSKCIFKIYVTPEWVMLDWNNNICHSRPMATCLYFHLLPSYKNMGEGVKHGYRHRKYLSIGAFLRC